MFFGLTSFTLKISPSQLLHEDLLTVIFLFLQQVLGDMQYAIINMGTVYFADVDRTLSDEVHHLQNISHLSISTLYQFLQ